MGENRPLSAFEDGPRLAQAIVNTVREPLLVLDKDLRVVAASRSFYETFQADRQETQGRLLYTLGDGQWDIPALRTLLEKVVPEHSVMDDYEVEHEFPKIGRRTMLLNARTVISENSADAALLLAIEDVSERRAHERELEHLVRQKELLLEEMRHRIANSLQIIASILLLKARSVQSDETRGHLQDAHKRVMSVAAVQQHLQASGHGEAIAVGSLPVEAMRSPGDVHDRRNAAGSAGDQGQWGDGRVQRGGQHRPHRHRKRHQRPEARLSSNQDGRPDRCRL